MKNNKIKLSVGLILSVFALFSFFIIPNKASALTCNSATITGDVETGTPPTYARFLYSPNYDTVANGGGKTTTVRYFYSEGTFPIDQFISGLSENTTYYYSLVITNDFGSIQTNTNSFTTPYCQEQVQNPTVTLYASPSTITSGQSSNLNWNSNNASYCSSSWSGSSSVSGSTRVYPTYTTNYTITCYGTNGQQVSDSKTVYVNQVQQICLDTNANNYRGVLPCTYYIPVTVNNQPTVVVYSDQVSVPFNGSATIRWITTNASYCNASGGSVGWAGARSIGPGSFFTGSLTSSKTFTLTCSNSFGSATDSETINVRNPIVATTTAIKSAKTSLVLISSSINRNQPIVPTIDNTRPRPGDEINYTVSYQNIGTGSITNLSLRIDLPLEIDYISSSPNNPTIYGNTLVFNLGTLKANGEGVITIKTRVRENVSEGTNLNFPATLSYIDPSGQPQSVNANVSAQVFRETEDGVIVLPLGANVFGAGFLPTNLFGWLFLLAIILVLIYLAKHLFGQSFDRKTTVVTDQPSGKKTTTTTVQ